MAERLDSLLVAGSVGFVQTKPVKADTTVYDPSKDQIKALLDDIDRLEKEKLEIEARLERCSRASDDEKTLRWIQKYDELKSFMVKGEFEQ